METERTMKDIKDKIVEIQKRVNEHQKTVAELDTTINETKAKHGRFAKVHFIEIEFINANFSI